MSGAFFHKHTRPSLFLLPLVFCLINGKLNGQDLNNVREKTIQAPRDTILIDTLSIVPSSFEIRLNGEMVDTAAYFLEPFSGHFYWEGSFPSDSLQMRYRVFPFSFTDRYANKDSALLKKGKDAKGLDPYTYRAGQKRRSSGGTFSDLNKKGSISRGITVGNTQNLTVDSDLDLEMTGAISKDIEINASVTNDNIPLQPEGNTQQIQEFDKVFIELKKDPASLIAGDFRIEEDQSHFLKYQKRAQGGTFSTTIPAQKNGADPGKWHLQTSAAVSKGKFARNIIQGMEGNQGPYRLKGNNNESFIIVLAGTERVFIDGERMERGQNNDYVIDYNAAEITFTANQLITKDKRIKVEFQYAQKEYTRSLFQGSALYEAKEDKAFFKIYSEQDAKNQPLQEDLTEMDKRILRDAGDDRRKMVVPSIEKDTFSNDRVMYRMTDSLGFDSVLVHSTDPDSSRFRVKFTDVGKGNGHYVQKGFSANGKVYEWVPPDTASGTLVPRGRFRPVETLPPPNSQRMAVAGGEKALGEHTSISTEFAMSQFDENTFSNLDREDDLGYAGTVTIRDERSLSPDRKDPWKLISEMGIEHVNKDFNAIERFRGVEFDRNWNLSEASADSSRQLGNATLKFKKRKTGQLGYRLRTLHSGSGPFEGDLDQGLKHELFSKLTINKTRIEFDGSLLNKKGRSRSTFLRHRSRISHRLPWFRVGYRDEHEKNTFRSPLRDTLLPSSYQFYEGEVFVTNPDTSDNNIKVFYERRFDKGVRDQALKRSNESDRYGLAYGLTAGTHQLKGKTEFRRLRVTDTNLTSEADDKNLLSRVDHSGTFLDGAIRIGTFYEVGSGMERKKEFIYLKVQPGKGSFTWNDYNDNGVKELNEFEKARFQDEAKYIRTFTPSDEFVRTFSTQFNHSLHLDPTKIDKEGDLPDLLTRFSDRFTFKIDRKTNNEPFSDALDPFRGEVPDTSLVSQDRSLRNTFFFNRSDPTFGADHTHRRVITRSLTSNGFTERESITDEVDIRWNITKPFTVEATIKRKKKISRSDFLDGRNFNISVKEAEPRFTYQPTTKLRGSIKGGYVEKKNKKEYGGQSAEIRKIGTQWKYNIRSRGSFSAKLDLINIRYSGEPDNPTAFEMLESLRPGQNLTWELRFQRNISENLQLNLNYNGRSSEDSPTVHNGGVEVRAFF